MPPTSTDPLLPKTNNHIQAYSELAPTLDHQANASNGNGNNKQDERHDRMVEYNGDDTCQVLFQLYGSVWHHVLPWCFATCLFTLAIIILRAEKIVDLTISNNLGHTFMSLLVSFLLVTRVTITYNRFMEARQHLSDMYRCCRELVQYSCILTSVNTNFEAIQWRQQVAYTTIVTLRMAQAAIEFRSSGVSSWDTHAHGENSPQEHERVPNAAAKTTPTSSRDFLRQIAHGPRTESDDNFRAPIIWAFHLRQHILDTRWNDAILRTRSMHVNEELKLLQIVQDFITAYHGHRKLISTPFPFPLIQMARTFLIFWVFSLPLVIVADSDSTPTEVAYTIHDAVEVVLVIFFCTYGFLGLEHVSVELDDPYGDDPNDFPGQNWSQLVMEDIYWTIQAQDGPDSALAVRGRVQDRMRHGTPLQLYRTNWKSGTTLSEQPQPQQMT